MKSRLLSVAVGLGRLNGPLSVAGRNLAASLLALMLAAEVASAPKLSVITNSFAIARQLAAGPTLHRVYVLGGYDTEGEELRSVYVLEGGRWRR